MVTSESPAGATRRALVSVGSVEMVRFWRVLNQVMSFGVGVCYGATVGYVLIVLATGVQESLRQLDPALQRQDRYTTSPGFDPVAARNAMERTRLYFAEHPDKQ